MNRRSTSIIFQCAKLTRDVINAMKCKPDDQLEWRNILQLLCLLRQDLACSVCGKFVSDLYTPARNHCHCICAACRRNNGMPPNGCASCRSANQAGQSGFEIDTDLNYPAISYVYLCKLIIKLDMLNKWANLQVATQNGLISFKQLVEEGLTTSPADGLSEKFRKSKVDTKKKEHHCRCGSGSSAAGNLTCLGQRCTCYKEGKGCINCKCVGCKNPNGTSGISTQHPKDP